MRLASVGDAGELERLNAEFNGKGKTTEESIRASLLTNRREVVIALGRQRRTAAGRCVQRKSFCWLPHEDMPEITEVYVRPGVSRRVAREMLIFAQEYVVKIVPLELLTGSDTTAAQKLLLRHRLECDGEMHMSAGK